MDETIIRLATAKDASLICDFNVAMAYETEHTKLDAGITRAGVDALLYHPDRGFYLVAERKRIVVGTLMITKEWSDWRNGFFWWIQSVYILPEFRRQGLFSCMYRFIQSLAESDPDVCGFRLYVERNNIAAQAAYENLGMVETHYKLYEELKADSDEQ